MVELLLLKLAKSIELELGLRGYLRYEQSRHETVKNIVRTMEWELTGRTPEERARAIREVE